MSPDNNGINIFPSLENPCTFLLAKEKTSKRIFNTNSKLSKNRPEKEIMPFKKTVSWLFNDISCYLPFSTNSSKGFIVSLSSLINIS